MAIGDIVARIDRPIASGADTDAFLDEIAHLITLAPICCANLRVPGQTLSRLTTQHSGLPRSITNELWFLPPEYASLSRANQKSLRMFFCVQ